jgi:thiol-disulfide isomerase/thioredoxin
MNLFFHAPWCSQCKIMHDTIHELGITSIDCSTNPEEAEKYGVLSLPAYWNGKELITGIKTKEDLIEFYAQT